MPTMRFVLIPSVVWSTLNKTTMPPTHVSSKDYYATTAEIYSRIAFILDRPLIAQSGVNAEEETPQEVTSDALTTVVTDGARQEERGEVQQGIVQFYRNVDPYPSQGLDQVLSRKYQVYNGNWSGSSAINVVLGAPINFPYALLNTSQNLQQKVNYNHYFRCSYVEVEIHVAGTMYHQGALMAAVIPFNKGAVTDPKLTDIWVMSTLDHAHVSPDSNTVTILRIPFMGQPSYWRHNLVNNEGYFGTLLMRVLVPLQLQNSAATPTIPVTVFARFVDPQVMAPTLHFVTQSGEQEAKSKQGILSSKLESVSNTVAKTVTKAMTSPFVTTAISLGKQALRVGMALGLDKPDSIESFKPVYLSTVNSLSVMNGMNVVNSLAMDVENKISNKPEDFCSPVPETSFAHIASMPGLFKISSFDDSVTTNTVVYKWHNSPCIAPATAITIQHIPCSAVASQFKFWSGAMKYSIYFKTSKFTICKVRISWHPTMDETILGVDGSGDFISMVVDVCGDTTVNFSIPYCKNEPYSTYHDARSPTWSEDQYAGAITLSVVNPIAPLDGTVTQVVYYVIYAAADPSMDFQYYSEQPGIGEVVPEDYNVIDTTNTTFAPPFIAQSGVKQNTCIPMTQFKGAFPSLINSSSPMFDKVVSGEKIESVLDLLHRFTSIGEKTLNNTPFKLRYPPKDTGGRSLNYPFDFWRYTFLFGRGGLEYKVTPKYNGTAIDGTMYARNYMDDQNVYSTYSDFGREGVVLENFHYKPSLEISLPQYGIYPYWWREWNYPTEFVGSPTLPLLNSILLTWYSTGLGEVGDINTQLFMAIKDDCSFGYPRGFPKITQIYANQFSEDRKTNVIKRRPTALVP